MAEPFGISVVVPTVLSGLGGIFRRGGTDRITFEEGLRGIEAARRRDPTLEPRQRRAAQRRGTAEPRGEFGPRAGGEMVDIPPDVAPPGAGELPDIPGDDIPTDEPARKTKQKQRTPAKPPSELEPGGEGPGGLVGSVIRLCRSNPTATAACALIGITAPQELGKDEEIKNTEEDDENLRKVNRKRDERLEKLGRRVRVIERDKPASGEIKISEGVRRAQERRRLEEEKKLREAVEASNQVQQNIAKRLNVIGLAVRAGVLVAGGIGLASALRSRTGVAVSLPTPSPAPAPAPAPEPAPPPIIQPSPVIPGLSLQPSLSPNLLRESTRSRTDESDCQIVERRRRRRGVCREGFFREEPGRTKFVTWRTRRCDTGSVLTER